MKPFNILYIHSHDTGRLIQPYGYSVPTPRLQQLAEQGVVFRNAFAAAPTCSPSRAALLTGQSAHSSGMLGLAHRGFSLNEYNQHLIHTLRAAGYQSTLIGMQHVAKDPRVVGYDRIVEVPSSHSEHVVPAAVAFLENAPPQPFFASVGFFETHRPFPRPGPNEDPRFTRPPTTLPDTPDTREEMAAFQASARLLDEGVGTVLDALEANGLAENTLVLCTTDHGPAFPGMKSTLTDHGIGVMLILRGPHGLQGGRVVDALVSQIDLFPTLCDLLGLERPEWLEGHSLVPLLRGEREQTRDAIFAEVNFHAALEPQRAVRTTRYKYIRRFGERPFPILPNCDDSPSKDLWLHCGWREQRVAAEQLYDLIFDPNEGRNLLNDPAVQPVLSEMRDRLGQWMQATDDPLLQGPLLPPSGVELNDPAGLSPEEATSIVP